MVFDVLPAPGLWIASVANIDQRCRDQGSGVARSRNEMVSDLGLVRSLVFVPQDRPLYKRGGTLETS
jgi:hypothetical protein